MFPARKASDILQDSSGTDVLVHLKPNILPSRDDVLHCNTTGKYATLDLFLFVMAPQGHSNPSSWFLNTCCQNTISFKSLGVQAFEMDVKSHRGCLEMPQALTGSRILMKIRLNLISYVQCAQVGTASLGRAGPEPRFLNCRHSSQGHSVPAHGFPREEAVVLPEMHIVSRQARKRWEGSLILFPH